MSLIESTLGKVRRAAGAVAKPEPLPTRVAVSAEPLPEPPAPLPDYEHRRVAVDMAALRAAGHLPDPAEEPRFSEHFRRIKRSVVTKATAPGAAAEARLVAITSPLPGDGKIAYPPAARISRPGPSNPAEQRSSRVVGFIK